MRPKKIVLLVYGEDEDLRLLEYPITLWGYQVLTASTADDVREMLRGKYFAEVMIVPAILSSAGSPKATWGNLLIREVQQLSPETRSVLLSKRSRDLENSYADALLKRDARDFPHDLRERLRLLTMRKRGPKRPAVELMLAKAAAR